MTRDDVIRLARMAGLSEPNYSRNFWAATSGELERFAVLVIKEHTQQVKETPVHKIDGADWPDPDSGFAKLGGM